MLGNAVKLLSLGSVKTGLWVATFLSYIGAFTLGVFLDEELFPKLGFGLQTILVLALFLGVIGLFVTGWNLTRALAEATTEEKGFVGPWLGWGLVGVLPGVLVLGIFEIRSDTSTLWWLSSLCISATISLAAPILVHSTGRAINDNGPSLGSIFDYWLSNYGRLFFAYFLATAPLTFVTDGLYEFGNETATDAVLSSFTSSIISCISSILAIVVTVLAYREVEAAKPPAKS